jgi:hypothetical protein
MIFYIDVYTSISSSRLMVSRQAAEHKRLRKGPETAHRKKGKGGTGGKVSPGSELM